MPDNKEPKENLELGKAWSRFFAAVFEPLSFCLILFAIGLIVVSALPAKDVSSVLSAVLAILAAIFAGVAGARIVKHLEEFGGTAIIAARGKTAVRSLKALLSSVTMLGRRVSSFQAAERDKKEHSEVTLTHYDELLNLSKMLQEQVIVSIENWTDLVAEADIASQLEKLSGLADDVEQKRLENEKLKGLLSRIEEVRERESEQAKQERRQVQENLAANMAALQKAQSELRRRTLGVFGTSAATFPSSVEDLEAFKSILRQPQSDDNATIVIDTGKEKNIKLP